jgi:ArsR family transcriptional regulator, lead/cadmium/zinc/bismuth-responsive transcriptional repressor
MSTHSDNVSVEGCQTRCLHPEVVGPLAAKVLRNGKAEELAAMFALLADPTRTKLLHALSLAEELCVCDLALAIGSSQSATSHQLRLLRHNGIVTRRKAGRVAYYRLADEHVRRVLADGLGHALERDGGQRQVS